VRLYYHCDGRTNVARLTAAAQTVVESYESDPYGNVTIKDQAGSPASTSPVGNPFVFQRRRHDAESGLLYFRARHYDPQRGHWLQRDPLGFKDSANAHESFVSNPVHFLDPLGTEVKVYHQGNASTPSGEGATGACVEYRLYGNDSSKSHIVSLVTYILFPIMDANGKLGPPEIEFLLEFSKKDSAGTAGDSHAAVSPAGSEKDGPCGFLALIILQSWESNVKYASDSQTAGSWNGSWSSSYPPPSDGGPPPSGPVTYDPGPEPPANAKLWFTIIEVNWCALGQFQVTPYGKPPESGGGTPTPPESGGGTPTPPGGTAGPTGGKEHWHGKRRMREW